MDMGHYILAVWAVLVTVLYIRHTDKGHFLVGVPDTHARETVAELFRRIGIKEKVSFELGARTDVLSRQMLLSDGRTVIHELTSGLPFPATGLSLPIKDPLRTAEDVMSLLRSRGYGTSLWCSKGRLSSNSIVVVTSEAFPGMSLTLRTPDHKLIRDLDLMGGKEIRITK